METDEFIKHYFHLGLSHKEICLHLENHQVYISIRTLKRKLKKLNLCRRLNFSPYNDVYQFIETQIHSSCQLHGYKWMHRKCLNVGLVVTQSMVSEILHVIDPIGIEVRKKKKLRRRMYNNKGPNFLWHTDCYDKLKPFGISISGCIDGFSRFVIWMEAVPSCNDPRIISGFFFNAVRELGGCPKTIRADAGTENRHIKQIQTFFHRDIASNRPPFIYGTSPANQRIEAWWSILRKHNSQFWMNLFQKLQEDGHFSGSWLDKNLIRFCFLDIIRVIHSVFMSIFKYKYINKLKKMYK